MSRTRQQARSNSKRTMSESFYSLTFSELPPSLHWQELKDMVRRAGSTHAKVRRAFIHPPDNVGTISGSVDFTLRKEAYSAYEYFSSHGYPGRSVLIGLHYMASESAKPVCVKGPTWTPLSRRGPREMVLGRTGIPHVPGRSLQAIATPFRYRVSTNTRSLQVATPSPQSLRPQAAEFVPTSQGVVRTGPLILDGSNHNDRRSRVLSDSEDEVEQSNRRRRQ